MNGGWTTAKGGCLASAEKGKEREKKRKEEEDGGKNTRVMGFGNGPMGSDSHFRSN